MNESQSKRRIWIRNLIIVFLLLLLALTLFSGTILNYSLPQVAVQYPRYGTITTRIRQSATVTPNQSFSVTVEQSRAVESVAVRAGQTVKKGDVLFTLEAGDSTELDNARTALDNLKIQLIQKQKQDPARQESTSGTTLANLQSELSDARDTLALLEDELKGIREKKDAIPTSIEVRAAEAELEQLKTSLENFESEIARLTGKMGALGGNGFYTAEEIEDLIADASDALDEATSVFGRTVVAYEALASEVKDWQGRTDAAKTAWDNAKDALTDYEANMPAGSVTMESLMQAQQTLNTQKQDLANKKQYFSENEYNTARAVYVAAKAEYDEKYLTATEDERAAMKAALKAAEDVYRPLESEYQSIQAAELAITRAEQQYRADYYSYLQSTSANTTLNRLKEAAAQAEKNYNDINTQLQQYQKEAEDAKALCTERQEEVEKAKAELSRVTAFRQYDELSAQIRSMTAEKEKIEEKITAVEKTLDSASDEFTAAVTAELNAKNREITAQKKIITGIEAQIATAKLQVELDASDGELNRQQYEIELAQLKKSIEKAEAEVARLEKQQIDGKVLAPVSGVVESLSVSAGQTAQANTPLASIILSDQGYTMQCTVTAEQAAKVRVGDVAEIQWYRGGNAPEARVSAIRTDAASQGKNKIIVLDVTGDIQPGITLDFTLGSKNQSYDCVVPNSAVREDANGTFVLVVSAKSTPLGNRYTARRVEVSVIASDDVNSAVSTQISGEYVITTSPKPISDGMPVRLSDEN